MSIGIRLLAIYAVILVGAFAQLQKVTINCAMSVCLSVCPPVCVPFRPSISPHRTTRLPLEGFS